MAEDILEQLVEDYLRLNGYLTMANVRFGPRKGEPGYAPLSHNQPSDIDVLALNPNKRGPSKVLAVSCKAMQGGFSPNRWLDASKRNQYYNGKRAPNAWKHMHELWDVAWNQAHRTRVKDLTGQSHYTYILAVTRLDKGGSPDMKVLEDDPQVGKLVRGVSLRFLPLSEIWNHVSERVTTQVEPSALGRLSQILRAADLP